jgi:hypothetical protein
MRVRVGGQTVLLSGSIGLPANEGDDPMLYRSGLCDYLIDMAENGLLCPVSRREEEREYETRDIAGFYSGRDGD